MKQIVDQEYNKSSPEDIERFSKNLIGRTLRDYVPENLSARGTGKLGDAVEKYFFKINPGGSKDPDFPEAGVELKTTGLKIINNRYRAKERLFLGNINFTNIINEKFESSSLIHKINLMLLMFYLYSKEMNYLDYKFIESKLFSFPQKDLMIIRNDWNFIVNKIKKGKAHEISEGDTFYLGACPHGANKRDLSTQPCSSARAMRRAFSLKPSYMNIVVDDLVDSESIIKEVELKRNNDINLLIISRLTPFYGLDIETIEKKLNLKMNRKAKNFFSSLTVKMLGSKKGKVEELEKAGIVLKTIRLKNSGMPKEDMSFPYFKYQDIVKEYWESSTLKGLLERKFLFVIFQYNNDRLVFKKAMFWNIPYADMQEAKKVWRETVKRIKRNKANDLPKSSENFVLHVRPHGRSNKDVNEDLFGNFIVKKSFWLNKKYIKEITK
jgi:DNA mismatch repair protein MutH